MRTTSAYPYLRPAVEVARAQGAAARIRWIAPQARQPPRNAPAVSGAFPSPRVRRVPPLWCCHAANRGSLAKSLRPGCCTRRPSSPRLRRDADRLVRERASRGSRRLHDRRSFEGASRRDRRGYRRRSPAARPENRSWRPIEVQRAREYRLPCPQQLGLPRGRAVCDRSRWALAEDPGWWGHFPKESRLECSPHRRASVTEADPIRVYVRNGMWLSDYGSYSQGWYQTRREALKVATEAARVECRAS
jgi:hypothetical protein